MIVACTNCNARFNFDGAQLPANTLSVRCPKCGQIMSSQPLAATASDRSAVSVGDSPASRRARVERPTPAPAYRPESSAVVAESATIARDEGNEIVQLLSALLHGGEKFKRADGKDARPAWERRRALLCLTPERAERVAPMLCDAGYEVFIAADTMQAITRMREDSMDVVVLEPEFDGAEQGAAFVTRAVGALRPAERRRVFFVQISPTARTFDAHAAFVNHYNLAINAEDLDDFVQVLERALREFTELYRNFNKAVSTASL